MGRRISHTKMTDIGCGYEQPDRCYHLISDEVLTISHIIMMHSDSGCVHRRLQYATYWISLDLPGRDDLLPWRWGNEDDFISRALNKCITHDCGKFSLYYCYIKGYSQQKLIYLSNHLLFLNFPSDYCPGNRLMSLMACIRSSLYLSFRAEYSQHAETIKII